MNVKNNKRRRDSVEKIEKAFFEELQNKSISQIRVSDICISANINRSTFYANYEDIYDLADKIRQKLEEEVNQHFIKEINAEISENNFLKLFHHIKDNQILYFLFFKLGYENQCNLKMHEMLEMNYEDKSDIDYHIEFFRNGFNAIVKKWLESGCKKSPEEMRDILLKEYKGRLNI